MASLNGFKSYAVSFGETTDTELQMCLDAAIGWATNAGIDEMDDDPLYDMLVYRLAVFYHDHRGFPDRGNDAEMIGINGIALQLRKAGIEES